jgi:hypothetical protein
MTDNIELTLLLKPTDADSDQLDQATRSLRTELQDLPIDSVALTTAGEAPAGTKSGEAVTLGALTLTLAPIVVPALVDFLKTWLARKEGRRVVIRRKVGDAATEVEISAPLSDSALSELVEKLSPQ